MTGIVIEMGIVGSEQEVLNAVAELGYADKFQIKQRTGFTLGYIDQLVKYLLRKGYLKHSGGIFTLAPAGKSAAGVSGVEVDGEMISDIAGRIAREVADEIRASGLPGGGDMAGEAHTRGRVQIKTDFSLDVEDETKGLESNIERIGTKVEKEKRDIDGSVELLRNLKKKEKG